VNKRPKLPKAIFDSLSRRDLYTQALFERPESLGSLLPYADYLPQHGIFHLKDGSLGAVFEVELLEHEPMTEKHILRAVGSTKHWFSLPENCVLQILYDTSYYSALDPTITDLTSQYKGHSVSNMLFAEKTEKIKSSCNTVNDTTPIKRKLLVAIRYFLQKRSKITPSDLSKKHKILLRETTSFTYNLAVFTHLTNYTDN
jgi:hypothetical protein